MFKKFLIISYLFSLVAIQSFTIYTSVEYKEGATERSNKPPPPA